MMVSAENGPYANCETHLRTTMLSNTTAKRACGAECAAVLQVQLVAVITVENQLAFEATRQAELSEEDVARVVVPLTRVAITVTRILVTLSRVVIERGAPTRPLQPPLTVLIQHAR